jgi:non-haem Fe2+, alpha-ketoglutarate-dependent halogenase
MLSPAQLQSYQKDGIVFPVRAFGPEETARFRRGYEELEEQAQAPQKRSPYTHLFFPWAYELVMHPTVVAAAADILGSEVLVESSLCLCKHAFDGTFAPWHQDGTYSLLDTTPSVSAWIALTSSTRENGCMRVVPGSHTQGRLAYRMVADKRTLFEQSPVVQVEVDESRAVDVELRPGEMSLHDSSIIHGSEPNRSGVERFGIVIRFITPAFQDRKGSFPVLRARDSADCGRLPVLSEPPTGSTPECFRRWRAACPLDMPRSGLRPPP